MLLRWCDKDCGIFSTLCTLLWVLAHDNKKKNVSLFVDPFMIVSFCHAMIAYPYFTPPLSVGYTAIHDIERCHLHVARDEKAGSAQGKDAQERPASGRVFGCTEPAANAHGTVSGAGLWRKSQQTVRVLFVCVWVRAGTPDVGSGSFLTLPRTCVSCWGRSFFYLTLDLFI